METEKLDKTDDTLFQDAPQRDLLGHVPLGKDGAQRLDRRGARLGEEDVHPGQSLPLGAGVRYPADLPVTVVCRSQAMGRRRFACRSVNISTSGILLNMPQEVYHRYLTDADNISLRFTIPPGVMPEGYEMRVHTYTFIIRTRERPDGTFDCGLLFTPTLSHYTFKRRGRVLALLWVLLLALLGLMALDIGGRGVPALRAMWPLYVYGAGVLLLLAERLAGAALYRPVPITGLYTPGVSVIVPCQDDEDTIQDTIISCLDQNYPPDALEVIVVDDGSADGSWARVEKTREALMALPARYRVADRLRCVQLARGGRRGALLHGVSLARHDLVVFVGPGGRLCPLAVRALVQPLRDAQVGAVSGRADALNTFESALTRMQSAGQYLAFRVYRAAQSRAGAVMSLSGMLACYRKEVLEAHGAQWMRRAGDARTGDRTLTGMVLGDFRTVYQDTAVCEVAVAGSYRAYRAKRMARLRGWLLESFGACMQLKKRRPLAAASSLAAFLLLLLSPVAFAYALVVAPLVQGIWPAWFFMEWACVAMLMGAAHLYYRRSSVWPYGVLFGLYHYGSLLWQMPAAWLTLRKREAGREAEATAPARRDVP